MKPPRESAQFSEEFLRRVVTSSPDCIKVLDLDGHLLSMNDGGQEALEIVDLIPHLGSCWIGWWSGEAGKAALAAVEEARRGGTGHFEAFAETFGGTPKWWDVTMSPILGADGRPEKLLSVSRDVTRRKRVEQELAAVQARINTAAEAERARLASVFKHSPSFMAVLSGPEHVFELVNDRYLQLVGGRDLLRKPVRVALPELAGQGFFDLLDNVYATGVPFVGQDVRITLQREAGHPPEERFLDFVYQPTFEGDESVSGILVHGVDRTERKTAETALLHAAEQVLASERSARSEAERTSRMKDEFLATLSHELRTPLNAILGWTQVLRGDPANSADVESGLATIERNARVQNEIIEDLLDMSKIISGKVRLDVQRIDLAAVVEAASRPSGRRRRPETSACSPSSTRTPGRSAATRTVCNRYSGTC